MSSFMCWIQCFDPFSLSSSMKQECCGLRSLQELIWRRKISLEPGERHRNLAFHFAS